MPRFTPVGALALIALAAVAGLWCWHRGPFGQDIAYHDFADQRPLFGVPHGLNVLSNIPFLVVGIAGLALLLGPEAQRWGESFVRSEEHRPFAVFFVAVALTSVGSAYYHLEPTNARLVWDRLPMAV